MSLQIFLRLSPTNFTWSILENFVPNVPYFQFQECMSIKGSQKRQNDVKAYEFVKGS